MKKGVFSWYDFTPGSYVLCVDVPDAVAEMLKQKGLYVALATGKEIMDGKPSFFSVNFEEPETLQCSDTRCAEGEFDYVISVKSPECVSDSVRLLTLLRRYLKPEGTLLLGMDNRLGVRYFCGDIDPYTGRAFDGIELYSDVTVDLADGQQGSGASEESVVGQEGQGRVAGQVRSVGGRCYSKDEIRHLLEVAGFRHQSFYSVFPDLDSAQLIYADGFVPNEKLETRYIPGYRNPSGVKLQ